MVTFRAQATVFAESCGEARITEKHPDSPGDGRCPSVSIHDEPGDTVEDSFRNTTGSTGNTCLSVACSLEEHDPKPLKVARDRSHRKYEERTLGEQRTLGRFIHSINDRRSMGDAARLR